MEIKGKLKEVLEMKTGTTKAGKEWQSQSIVLDNGDDFNNEVCVNAFGDKVKQIRDLKIGDDMTILCNIYSREWKGAYYNSIDGYHFSVSGRDPQDILGNKDTMLNGSADDLPF
tara:strand:+ start:8137 stop:8478 length:342 start_codon:yes stop_codon:yes gene_type:complete